MSLHRVVKTLARKPEMPIPKTIADEKDIFVNAFPKSLASDVNSLLDKVELKECRPTECFQINYENEMLSIPYRIYCDDTVHYNLTEKERLILHCLFTRHHDGHVREKHLKEIISINNYLTTPFIVQLLGEYVIELLIIIRDNLSVFLLDNLIRLKGYNKLFFTRTEQRIQSYWDCYYTEQNRLRRVRDIKKDQR
jgi:hypothetical protein